jgi:uncharacterized membrane protein HdeD (DUF308 family)
MPSPSLRSAWLSLEAAALILLGAGALIFPILAGVAAALILGWTLFLVGVVGIVSAVGARRQAHLGMSLLSAAIALVIGGLILLKPVAGAVGLSFLVGLYLLLDGATLCALALNARRRAAEGWRWILVAGLADLLLAAAVAAMSAAGSVVIVGVIVGVDLLAAGVGLFFAARMPGSAAPMKPAHGAGPWSPPN